MIAVHMLSHTIRRNMTKATLLTGDLDFKPLIYTLIQEGMFVTLWCEKSSTSKDLVYSADSRRGLDLWSIWNLTTKDFQLRNPIPKAFSQPGINSNGFTLVKSGTSSLGGEAYLYHNENSQFMIVYRDFMNDGYFVHWQYKDQDILERLLKVKEDGVTFEWSS